MHYRQNITFEDQVYSAIAMIAAHNGKAVLISLSAEGSEVGKVKMVASIPNAAIKWDHLDEDQFIYEAWSQFVARGLARAALSSWPELVEIELE